MKITKLTPSTTNSLAPPPTSALLDGDLVDTQAFKRWVEMDVGFLKVNRDVKKTHMDLSPNCLTKTRYIPGITWKESGNFLDVESGKHLCL